MPYRMLNVVTAIAIGWLVSTGFAGLSFAQDPQKKSLDRRVRSSNKAARLVYPQKTAH